MDIVIISNSFNSGYRLSYALYRLFYTYGCGETPINYGNIRLDMFGISKIKFFLPIELKENYFLREIKDDDIIFIENEILEEYKLKNGDEYKAIKDLTINIIDKVCDVQFNIINTAKNIFKIITSLDFVDTSLSVYYDNLYTEQIKTPLFKPVDDIKEYCEQNNVKFNFPEWFLKIKIFLPKYGSGYRLGDIAYKQSNKKTGIGENVKSRTLGDFFSDMPKPLYKYPYKVKNKVLEVCNSYNIEITSDVYMVHCRLGDKVYLDDFQIKNFKKTVDKIHAKHNLQKAKIITGLHNHSIGEKKFNISADEYIIKNYSKIRSYKNYLESLGMEVDIVSNRDVDYDFCLLSSGICIEEISSGFSKFANFVSKLLHENK